MAEPLNKTLLIAAVLFSVSAIGCCLCVGFNDLVLYRIIGGVGIGIVSIVSPMYISEISPAKIRGTMVGLYQLAVTCGLLLAYLVNYIILPPDSCFMPSVLCPPSYPLTSYSLFELPRPR